MRVCLNYFDLPSYVLEQPDTASPKINWNFEDDNRSEFFFDRVQYVLSTTQIPDSMLSCSANCCTNYNHREHINGLYCKFVDLILAEGERAFGLKRPVRAGSIPGWNDFVRDQYQASRNAFLFWKREGSPRHGPVALAMRSARAQFKLALRRCRQNIDNIRATKIIRSFHDKPSNQFWKLIKKVDNHPPKLSKRIDSANSEESICVLWR